MMERKFFINQKYVRRGLSLEAALLYSVLNELDYLSETVRIGGIEYGRLKKAVVEAAVPVIFERGARWEKMLKDLERFELLEIPEGVEVGEGKFVFSFGEEYYRYFFED